MRQLDLDLGDSRLAYQPGDVLAMVPQQPAEAVDALCCRCGWDPLSWVRVEPAAGTAAAAGEPAAAGGPTAAQANGGSGSAGCAATVRLGALIAGALDINGASPRRFFFQARQGGGGAGRRGRQRVHAKSQVGNPSLTPGKRRC